MMRTPVDQIEEILKSAFKACHVEITDASDQHATHAEAQQSGGGHYRLLIVSKIFEGKSLLARHRLVYQALKKKLEKEIHALSVQAYSLQEYERLKKGKMDTTFIREDQPPFGSVKNFMKK